MINTNQEAKGYSIYEETWKDIKDFEGLYQVSTHGRIKSLEKIVIGNNGVRKLKELIKSPSLKGAGYLNICLNKNGVRKYFAIHRLVAVMFSANLPDNYLNLDINHKDGNKTNNHISNLEWCTHLENIKHGHSSGIMKKASGINHGKAKPVIDTSNGILYNTIKEAAAINNINVGTLKNWLKNPNRNKTKIQYA